MSQRGSRRVSAPQQSTTHWWSYIRTILTLSLALTLGTTLTLTAQDPQPPQPAAKMVTVHVEGTVRQVSTTRETVKALLQQENITLNPRDYCTPAPATAITDGLTVTIERVTMEMITDRVPIEAPVITRWDRRMTVQPVTIRAGHAGTMERTWVVWKKDGKVSVKWVQRTKVLQKPVPKIVVRGNLASRGINGRRVLSMVATAYDPGPLSCGPNATGRTAIGLRATKGVIAVDPRVIPLGSRVYVDGYGAAIAADTGRAIKGNRIDVCFPSRSEALQWGRRTVTVTVLD